MITNQLLTFLTMQVLTFAVRLRDSANAQCGETEMCCTVLSARQAGLAVVFSASMLLAGCGGGGSGRPEVPTGTIPGSVSNGVALLSGSVGDGPVVDADLEIYDADGNFVASGVAGSDAKYQIPVPEEAKRPCASSPLVVAIWSAVAPWILIWSLMSQVAAVRR
ncbi:MAG: hypothetical protein R3E84_08990 [Pseudomonadales bacterium]